MENRFLYLLNYDIMTEGLNTKHNVEITVLTPINIGAGAEKDLVKGVDFVEKDGKIYILNLKKMIENGIDPAELSPLFANKNHDAVLQKVQGKLDKVTDAIITLPGDSDNDIKSFIKNELSGRPIIPGSSLKGAIRSVILDYLIEGQKNDFLQESKNKNNNAKRAEERWFGSSTDGDELMRFIKISDMEFDKTALVNTKIFNLFGSRANWQGGWKHEFKNGTTNKYQTIGFNTLYEAILPKEESVCSVMISDSELFSRKISRYEENKDALLSLSQLFGIINNHTKKYIEKEIAFFKKYSTEKTDKIIESLVEIEKQIPEDNSVCVLKMSAGSGFHSITGDWQYDDYSKTGIWEGGRNEGKQKYKSRKIAIHNDCFLLMGFVKLRTISEEESSKRKEFKLKKEQQAAIKKQVEQEKNEQLQKKLTDYGKLIELANSLLEENQINEAKNCLEQAQILFPDGTKHNELLIRVDKIVKEQEENAKREQAIIANQKQLESDRLTANQVPLSEKLKTSNKILTIVGNIKTWMKLNNVNSLSQTEIEAIFAKVVETHNSLNNRDRKNFSLKPFADLIDNNILEQWLNNFK